MKLLDTWIRNDRAWCRAVKADGWGGLVQGAFSGGLAKPLYPEMRDHCEEALRNARLEGMVTGAYTNAAPWRSPQFWFDKTVEHIGAELEHLSFLVVDHELHEGARPTDEDMREFIRLLKTLGKPLIGYSADWFLGMRAAHGFQTRFALDGYWYAHYDRDPTLGTPAWPMAPRIVGKQYRGSTTIQGKTVDLNEFDDAWIAEIALAEEDDMGNIDEERDWLGDEKKRTGQQAMSRLNDRMNWWANEIKKLEKTVKELKLSGKHSHEED